MEDAKYQVGDEEVHGMEHARNLPSENSVNSAHKVGAESDQFDARGKREVDGNEPKEKTEAESLAKHILAFRATVSLSRLECCGVQD